MKEEIAFRNSKSLRHTRAYFDMFNAMANWAVNEAGGAKSVFGSKPSVADYTETNLGVEAGRAVKANTENLPDILAFLDRLNPGFSDQLKQGSKNTLSLLRGEIPQDVQDQVQRSSAYRSLMGGYAGSGMSKALTARDLGRTSLDLMQLGGNSAQLWSGLSSASVSPFMVTAPAQADMTLRNNLFTQATAQNRANVAAAPDPGAAGIFNLQTAMGAMAASFGMGSAMGAQSGSNALAAANAKNSGGSGNQYAGTYNGVPYNNNNIPTANAVPWGSYTAGDSPYGPYASGYQFPGG